NEYSKAQNEEIDLQISLLRSEKAEIEQRRKNLMDIVSKGEYIQSIIDEIRDKDEQIQKIDNRIREYEESKKTFTKEDLDFIRSKFTGYVREECNEGTLAFLNDTIDKIGIDDTISVKLKNNISVDRDTKKIFSISSQKLP
ncbi:MAG: hypothetical protein ACI4JM_02755, partial [Oscillospiraceae bacterium]